MRSALSNRANAELKGDHMENNFNLEDFKFDLEDYNFEDLEDFNLNLEDYNFEDLEKLIQENEN